jgi:hypothetical protein
MVRGRPSVPPVNVAGATLPWVASAGAGAQSARVFVSGLDDVSAPPTPLNNSTVAETASISSTGPAPARNLRLARTEAMSQVSSICRSGLVIGM